MSSASHHKKTRHEDRYNKIDLVDKCRVEGRVEDLWS
jgi:hypothetical protein